MNKVVEFLHSVEEKLLAFLLAAMTLVTFVQVVLRYGFNSGMIWALELVTFLFAWLVILGVSYGIRIHSHIGVDAFVRLFPAQIQRILALIAITAGIAYSAMMAYGGWEEMVLSYEVEMETLDLKWPMWIPISAIFIGFSLAVLRLIIAAYRIIIGKDTTMLADEGEDAIKQFAEQDKGGDQGGTAR